MTTAPRRAFGLEPGEGRTASLMALHSFAMGLSTVFFETAASAFFVTRFAATALPWVYIAAAVVSTGAGALFSAARQRLGFRTLMAAVLLFLCAGVVGLRLGLALGEPLALVFGLLVFYRLLSVLTDLEYWAVASQLYDVRQAKRLFGLVGTGEVVARIAGALAVPLLVAALGVADLLWLSGGALLLCLGALLQVLPRDTRTDDAGRRARLPGVTGANPEPEGLRALLARPYLRQIFVLALCGVLAKHFVDFAFLATTRERATDVAAFASFFGLFSGLTQGLSLLTRLFVSAPLLTRFGIRAGLLVLPLAHLACTAALLLAGLLPGGGWLVLWLVIGNQGLYKVLKHPIDNPCFKVLYQPLARRDRLAAQVAVETVVNPVGTGAAGLVMLLFALRFDPVSFAWTLTLVFTAWVAVASRTGRAYGDALVRALRGRLVRGEALELGDEASRRAVEAALRSERAGDVLFALDLLERAAPGRAAHALAGLVTHAAPEVRRSALQRLGLRGEAGALALVASRLGKEPDPEVRKAAIAALVALQGGEAAAAVAACLADPDEGVRVAALGALLRADPRPGSPWRAELRRRAASPDPSLRLDAARALVHAPRGAFDDELRPLLEDRDRGVRLAALAAAGRTAGPGAWPVVITALGDRRTSGAAVTALIAGRDAVVPLLSDALGSSADPYVQIRLLRVAASLGATSVLRQAQAAGDGRVRLAALRALAAGRQPFGDEATPPLLDALRREARHAAAALRAARDLLPAGSPGAFRLLGSALVREADRARERAVLWMAAVHDPRAVVRVRQALAHEAREKRALALELLDVALSGEERELALALCAEPAARADALDTLFAEPTLSPDERLRTLLASDREATEIVRAAALLAVAHRGLSGLRAQVDHWAESRPLGLVTETALFARAVLRGLSSLDRKGRPMLIIEKVLTLRTARMFEEAPEEVLSDVAAILEEVEVAAGEAVFAKGDAGDSMYIIAEGRMRVSDGERTVSELGEGEVFGELALLDPEPRLYTVAALEDGHLLRLDRDAFLELMAGNIEIVRGVLHVLCERLRQADALALAGRN